MGTENKGYEIIRAVDARSIYNFDIQFEGKQTQAEDDNTSELAMSVETDDEKEDLDLEASMPVLLDLQRMRIRWILHFTLSFSKRQLRSENGAFGCSGHGYILAALQLVFVGLLSVYLAFTFGWLKIPGLKTLIVGNNDFFFTKFHEIIWELKWLVTYILGLLYHRSGHLEMFLKELKLTRCLWKKLKSLGVCYFFVVVMTVVVAPTVLHALHFRDVTPAGSTKQMFICSSLFLMFRAVTAPSFCVVTIVLYLIKVQIEAVGKMLLGLHLSLGTPHALRKIRAVKKMIRKADTRLKWYLLCHLLLLLFTAFTGLFSLIERMEVGVAYSKNPNVTFIETSQTGSTSMDSKALQLKLINTKIDEIRRHLSDSNLFNTGPHQMGELRIEKQMQNDFQALKKRTEDLTLAALGNAQKMNQLTAAKNTTIQVITRSDPAKLQVKFQEKTKPARLMIESMVEFLEVTILFVTPLLLLIWQKRALLRITDEVYDLDLDDQRINGCLIQTEEAKSKIICVLKSIRTMTIFGMEVNFYKTAFLVMLTPFLTVALKALFRHYELPYVS